LVFKVEKVKTNRNMREVNSWSDITVGQYQEMMLVQKETEIGKFIEMIAIALDCDPQDIREMPYKDYSELQAKMSFISEEPKREVQQWFNLNGVWYGLEPDMSLITAGVFIDSEQFRQDPIVNLHNTLALIYRPIINVTDGIPPVEYQIEPHVAKGFEKRAALFKKELSIEVVLGATLFFSILGMQLSIHFLESFNNQMMTEMEMQKMKMSQTQTPTKRPKQKRSKKDTDSTI